MTNLNKDIKSIEIEEIEKRNMVDLQNIYDKPDSVDHLHSK
jgi:hypothetical protein